MYQNRNELSELIQDDDFIAWVLHPDEISNRRWQAYVVAFPDAEETVRAAGSHVRRMAQETGREQPTPQQSRRMWQVVTSNTHAGKTNPFRPVRQSVFWMGWRAAASVTLVLSLGLAAYWYTNRPANRLQPLAQKLATGAVGTSRITRTNTTPKPMTIILVDGSSVVLLPGGTLAYFATNQPNKREVTLTGRAFFEVVKDKTKPFFVYTDGMTTRVLGTSFLIDAPANGETIDVRVKTGRVAVFPLNPKASATERADFAQLKTKSLIVNPNEQISISRLNGKPAKLVVRDLPRTTTADISDQNFVFDETPVSVVFASLEKAYNVRIEYNEKTMSDCALNATLMGEPLAQKLTVICAALDAEFTLQNNRITINGHGCQ